MKTTEENWVHVIIKTSIKKSIWHFVITILKYPQCTNSFKYSGLSCRFQELRN